MSWLVFGPVLVLVGIVLIAVGISRRWVWRKCSEAERDAERRSGRPLIVCGLVLLLACPGSCFVACGPYLHPEAYIDDVASKGDAIVEAIRRFEHEHGRPPNDFEELIPSYLTALPETGFPGQAAWEYQRLDVRWPEHDRKWSLCAAIYPLVPVIDFDEFAYLPKMQPDPEFGYRRVVRKGDWAYLDE
jgi:hypothetical protein